MRSRRRAVAEFLISAMALFLQMYSWKALKQRDDHDVSALSVKGLIAGTGHQLAFHSAHDHDIGQIRTNKYRALAYGMCLGVIQRWIFPGKAFQYSFSSGGLVGTILYRFWYGVFAFRS